MMNLYSDNLLSSGTVQTQRILQIWFSVLEYTNNMKYAGDGKFIQVSLCQQIINIVRGLIELLRK